MRALLELSREDVEREIPYAFICTVRETSVWDTMRRRKLWSVYPKNVQDAMNRLCRQAHKWYLVTGVPDTVTMSTETFRYWRELADFCGSL